MQTTIHVTTKSKIRSLRQTIADDSSLEDFGLFVKKERDPARSVGWLKIHSTFHAGAINISWDKDSGTLVARCIAKSDNKTSPILGEFITYLTSKFKSKIRAILITP